MAFDEGCAMPAAVAIASMFAHCSQPEAVQLCVLDLGLSAASRSSLQHLLPQGSIDWLHSSALSIHSGSGEGGGGGSSSKAFQWVKLCLGAAAPRRAQRALYLDADVLVRGDVCQLWRQAARHGAPLFACTDVGFPAGHAQLPEPWDHQLDRYFNAGNRMLVRFNYAQVHDRMIISQ